MVVGDLLCTGVQANTERHTRNETLEMCSCWGYKQQQGEVGTWRRWKDEMADDPSDFEREELDTEKPNHCPTQDKTDGIYVLTETDGEKTVREANLTVEGREDKVRTLRGYENALDRYRVRHRVGGHLFHPGIEQRLRVGELVVLEDTGSGVFTLRFGTQREGRCAIPLTLPHTRQQASQHRTKKQMRHAARLQNTFT